MPALDDSGAFATSPNEGTLYSLANGNVELKPRSEPDPKKSELVPLAGAAERLAGWVKQGLGA